MGLAALVMAGGRATRMGCGIEKPLLEVAGESMLQRVVEVIRQSPSIDRIVVASSTSTPATTVEARKLDVEIVITPGDGFEEDMRFAIRKLSLSHVLVVSADLPLINPELIEEAVERYRISAKPSLAVMAKTDVYEKLSSKPRYVFKVDGQDLVPVGINIIDGRRIEEGELDQGVLVIESGDAALNVNTFQELQLARTKMKSEGPEMITEQKSRVDPAKVPKTLQVARITAFAALSVVGSFIHLPSPVPTVAFDSAPGFFAALYFGPVDGFCILGIGHLASAIINGFPLGFLHLPIALGLALAGAAIGSINIRWSLVPAILTGVAINTALVVFAIPALGLAATLAFAPLLFLAATINAALASFTYLAVKRRLPI